ncbi:MAG: hypothetical protein GX309_09870 [Clostridiales bacterium]|nr:hypothetical protein [Clostridiales bacterium]
MDKITASKDLLGVYDRINNIVYELSEAYTIFKNSAETLSSEEVYKGQATDEINNYFISQLAHTAKLIQFYQVAGQYVMGYIIQMELTDEEIQELISFFGNTSTGN